MTAPNVSTPSPVPPTNPDPTTSAAPTGAPTSSAPPQPYRVTNAPPGGEWMVGRTIDEVAQLAQQMYTQWQGATQSRYNAPGAPQAPQAPSYGYQAPSAPPTGSYAQAPAPPLPANEDWLSNPAAAAQRYAEHLQATQVGPRLQQAALSVAHTNKALVQMQRPDEFKRWGVEIDLTLNQMAPDPSSWTPQNINAVVDVVKARHINDIIAEERAKYTNELGGASMRPSGAGAAGGTSGMAQKQVDFDKMPTGYRDALRTLNVEQSTIDEFLWRTYVKGGLEPDMDKARERWIKQVQRGDVFSDNRTLESPVY
jgi:hypothetical protein